MSLRWLTPGLAVVVALFFSCDNQGKGVGPDVIDELCELNREAVLALHSEEGMAEENRVDKYSYCDYWVDTNKDGIADTPEEQGSCKPLAPTDMDNILADCRRNGARILTRCQHEMEAMLACIKAQIDLAPSKIRFYTDAFTCWDDTNGNSIYNGGVFWTWPQDGSRPAADLNHMETCPIEKENCDFAGSCGTCGMREKRDANGNPVLSTVTGKPLLEMSPCYLMQELPRRGDETLRYNNVRLATSKLPDPKTGRTVLQSTVCAAEFIALNTCSKESELFLLNPAKPAASGTAGAGGVGTE